MGEGEGVPTADGVDCFVRSSGTLKLSTGGPPPTPALLRPVEEEEEAVVVTIVGLFARGDVIARCLSAESRRLLEVFPLTLEPDPTFGASFPSFLSELSSS